MTVYHSLLRTAILSASMLNSRVSHQSEVQKQRSLVRRMVFVHGFLLSLGLLLVARLIELQLIHKSEYTSLAQSQHFGGVTLPAQRGEILGLSSKNGETSILATNTTLDLVYVDPFIVDDPASVADTLADVLLTDELYGQCSSGERTCPNELIAFRDSPFAPLFDPLELVRNLQLSSGALLEPLSLVNLTPPPRPPLPDITEMRRLFARDIEQRISVQSVTFVPLKYNATKVDMERVSALNLAGISINRTQKLIFGNPEEIASNRLKSVSRALGEILDLESETVAHILRTRPLRYVPVMRRLSPALSLRLRQIKLAAVKDAEQTRKDRLRSVALIAEHWRFYPDDTVASHVVGFMNQNSEAQYGVERSFDAQLRGQSGLISTVSGRDGGQILTAEQQIVSATDGDTIVLTIDPVVQKEVERILDRNVKLFKAESAQAIVMDPSTGRIIAMANAPIFHRSNYADVFAREPIVLQPAAEESIVVELFDPVTNVRIIKDYYPKIFTPEGRAMLSENVIASLDEVERLYDLRDLARYYVYEGETTRFEVVPTETPHIWMRFENGIGVGAYINRAVQEVFEPGSIMKPITMAIAIDQGEVASDDTYDDTGPVEVDETTTIKNALLTYYGKVSMTDCLAFSINTCMTSISQKLGRKLFQRKLDVFGFGKLTGIELMDEQAGLLRSWRDWKASDLATASFGQGFSATPLHVITAYTALANGGRFMRPMLIDRILSADGTEDVREPTLVDQVITEQTAQTVTAMLTASSEYGFAQKGKVSGYKLAGKTGTSQIAGPGGRYETGTGSTINTFIGYSPPLDPRFILLVKFDRPKFIYNVFAESTAAPTFKEIAAFLYQYYGIPPDDE